MLEYIKGLHDIGNGHHAYLQPTGGWGYNNAGLITDSGEALLVDTLFDERMTAEMLAEMKDATGFGGKDIAQLVNTHANGDHTYGNRLVEKANIIASAATAGEMGQEETPEFMVQLLSNTDKMGDLGKYLQSIFGAFDFAGVKLRMPDTLFSGEKTLSVGNKTVELVEVGPAHTGGDILVFVPEDKVVYTGDILFIEGTPVMWAGPVGNWIAACDRLLDADVDVIVPGHGPVTDKAGVRANRDYLAYLETEAKKRHAAGMDSWEAAQDISIEQFGSWEDPERIAITVDTIYRELTGDTSHPDLLQLFERMAELDKRYNPNRPCWQHGHTH